MRTPIIAIVVVALMLSVAAVASADMRAEMIGLAGDVLSGAGEVAGSPSSDPTASPVPGDADSPDDAATEPPDVDDADDAEAAGEPGDDQGERPDNHGAAVSAVARDKDAVAGKTLANGKVITNHGQAVSAIARSGAGKSGSGGNGAGKSGGGKPGD